ncbi:MAG: adenylate/guanylate cyclase domain-containing protein, partial [Anaerolineales bacterium]|nr:adenylate/guanylate cyclase domain-containing protein [Anaerolineales bacterium]
MSPKSPLTAIESRLRYLLPAELYASMWANPSVDVMIQVHSHLRTLLHILYDYTSRKPGDIDVLQPGEVNPEWRYGTMMFTDLAGFTKLMEANAPKGREGAKDILNQINKYFSAMIEVISKSGGELVEFTGDAMLVVWHKNEQNDDTLRAVRAGLRMQRAMREFAEIKMASGVVSLQMRIGIHTGKYLTADIGTPRRMEHVFLGKDAQRTKLAESHGLNERVNLSREAYERVADQFEFENNKQPGYFLVVDNLTDKLGDYEIKLNTTGRRISGGMLINRKDKDEVMQQIIRLLDAIEPAASFIPAPVLALLMENVATREIPPDFPSPTVMFVNLMGLSNLVDAITPGEETKLAHSLSVMFSQINAIVESHGGLL